MTIPNQTKYQLCQIDEILVWLLVGGRGLAKIFHTPTPNEKPNEILIPNFNENLIRVLVRGQGDFLG